MTPTAALQREACRAAIRATLETLQDLGIPDAAIAEALASAAFGLSKATAVRYVKRRSSNDDGSSEPGDNQR